MPHRTPYPDLPSVMTASEVAGCLRVSKATITRLARSGALPAIPVPGRLLFVSDEVALFMKRSRSIPTKPPEQYDELPAL